jgi:hypothetical protein
MKLGNPLPFITPAIALILILSAIYFISGSGLFRKVKRKIRFHKTNRMLLSALLLYGYDNIDYMIKNRKSIVKQVGQDKTNVELHPLRDFDKEISKNC